MDINLNILLNLCTELKEARGVDAFFSYLPHVQTVTVDVHNNGWASENNPTHKFEFYIDGGKESAYHKTTTEYTKAVAYLTGLLEAQRLAPDKEEQDV